MAVLVAAVLLLDPHAREVYVTLRRNSSKRYLPIPIAVLGFLHATSRRSCTLGTSCKTTLVSLRDDDEEDYGGAYGLAELWVLERAFPGSGTANRNKRVLPDSGVDDRWSGCAKCVFPDSGFNVYCSNRVRIHASASTLVDISSVSTRPRREDGSQRRGILRECNTHYRAFALETTARREICGERGNVRPRMRRQARGLPNYSPYQVGVSLYAIQRRYMRFTFV